MFLHRRHCIINTCNWLLLQASILNAVVVHCSYTGQLLVQRLVQLVFELVVKLLFGRLCCCYFLSSSFCNYLKTSVILICYRCNYPAVLCLNSLSAVLQDRFSPEPSSSFIASSYIFIASQCFLLVLHNYMRVAAPLTSSATRFASGPAINVPSLGCC